ncbi:MAG: hypothetical protein QOF30_3638 [Acidimicrobiaceae bacterium]|nr:hypothetical protein [Acidimicrobiaceae bacterium]
MWRNLNRATADRGCEGGGVAQAQLPVRRDVANTAVYSDRLHVRGAEHLVHRAQFQVSLDRRLKLEA